MRLLRKILLSVVSLVLVSTYVEAKKDYNYLYENLPFPMQKLEAPVFKNNTVSVSDFGAKGDGIMLNTEAFSKAFDELSKKGGGKLVVPAGVWFTGPIELFNGSGHNMRARMT